MKSQLNTLLFGGCLITQPITLTSCAEGKLVCNRYGKIREVHTFGEMFQIVEILRGQRTIPAEHNLLWYMPKKLSAVSGASDFGELDVALLEPSSPTELTFRGMNVNRLKIKSRILGPIAKQGREPAALTAKWLRAGLIEMNEDIRREAGEQLLTYVRGDTKLDDLTRAVIAETRASKGDIAGGMRKMKELLRCPIGVVAYAFRYMPDGRVISWPAGFRTEVLRAAEQANLPVFDPAPLVASHGVETAISEDSRHYSEAFMPIVGDALVAFAQSVHGNAHAGQAVASA